MRSIEMLVVISNPRDMKQMCLKPIKLTILMTAVVFRQNFLQWRLLECFMHNYKQNMLCGRDDMRPLGPFGWLDGGVYWFNETLNEVLINASTYDGRFDFTSSLQRRRKELITENLVYRQSLQYTANPELVFDASGNCAMFPPKFSTAALSRREFRHSKANLIPTLVLPLASQSSPSKSSIACNCCRSGGGNPPWNQFPQPPKCST